MLSRIGTLISSSKATGEGSSFSPLSLLPVLFYDPSDISTLFQDTGGTSPVTTNGQTVARINNKGSASINLTQSTAGARPSYVSASGALSFDGTDDFLGPGAIVDPGASGECLIVCGKRTGAGSREMVFAFGPGSGAANAGDRWIEFSATNNIEGSASYTHSGGHVSVQVASTVNVTSGQNFWAIMNLSVGSQPQIIARRIGAAAQTANVGLVQTVSERPTSGGNPNFGTLAGAGAFTTACEVRTVLYWDRPLTALELTNMQAWLDARAA